MDIFGKDISIRQSFVIEIEMDCYHKCHMCKLERYAQIAHSLNNFIQSQTIRDQITYLTTKLHTLLPVFSCILNELDMCKCKSCAKEKSTYILSYTHLTNFLVV